MDRYSTKVSEGSVALPCPSHLFHFNLEDGGKRCAHDIGSYFADFTASLPEDLNLNISLYLCLYALKLYA